MVFAGPVVMLKGLAPTLALFGSALLGLLAAPGALAQQGGDPLRGQFGAIEMALSPTEAADDVSRMADALSKLAPQRPGVVDTYVLTASFWNEPVFENVRRARPPPSSPADTTRRTAPSFSPPAVARAPSAFSRQASPNNFNAALGRIAKVMDPKEDLRRRLRHLAWRAGRRRRACRSRAASAARCVRIHLRTFAAAGRHPDQAGDHLGLLLGPFHPAIL
jgi:hypothetical protein